jgi:hypothetical protein
MFSPAVREKNRYAQGVSLARLRSDLLEVPTGSLPVIRYFQSDKPQMIKLRRVSFSWSITSGFPVILPELAAGAMITSHKPS